MSQSLTDPVNNPCRDCDQDTVTIVCDYQKVTITKRNQAGTLTDEMMFWRHGLDVIGDPEAGTVTLQSDLSDPAQNTTHNMGIRAFTFYATMGIVSNNSPCPG
jgi:hypothetical protein